MRVIKITKVIKVITVIKVMKVMKFIKVMKLMKLKSPALSAWGPPWQENKSHPQNVSHNLKLLKEQISNIKNMTK